MNLGSLLHRKLPHRWLLATWASRVCQRFRTAMNQWLNFQLLKGHPGNGPHPLFVESEGSYSRQALQHNLVHFIGS